MTHVKIDSADFDPANGEIAAQFNAALLPAFAQAGWVFPPASAPALREALANSAPEIYLSPRAETLSVPTAAGGVDVRVLRADAPTAVYVHCHSGGWTIGAAAGQDARLEQIVAAAGVTVVSVDYRLAPENPFPAGLDDCEAALRWVVEEGAVQFGTDRVLVGGESAGANLALSALIRINRTHPGRVAAANLLYGNYDCTGTPTHRLAGDDVMITRVAMDWFYDQYLPAGIDRRAPEVSPLYADLRGLPPTLLTVGSADSLVDDSLFLAARLTASDVDCELHVVPGAEHGFDSAPYPAAVEAVKVIDEFLAQHATPNKAPKE